MITEKSQKIHETELPCRRCGVIDQHHVEPGTRPHGAKLVCGHCEAFIRWLPIRTAEEREAGRQAGIRAWMATQPPSPKQLQHLRRMGYCGTKPTTKLQAHDLIDKMRKARGWK